MEFLKDPASWTTCSAKTFWQELSSAEHVAYIYESEQAFIELLTEFVLSSIKAEASLILVLHQSHLRQLESTISDKGIKLFDLKLRDVFTAYDVHNFLSTIVFNGWPDEALFRYQVTTLITRARRNTKKVRAFIETSSELWSRGLKMAAVQTELLWNKFCETEDLSLLCAYPQYALGTGVHTAMPICDGHYRIIRQFNNPEEIMILNKQDFESLHETTIRESTY